MSPADPWTIVETAFDVRTNRHYEGLFAIGSGTLQQRAALEEGLRDDPQDVDYLRVMDNVTVEKFPDFKSRVGTYLPGVSGPHPTCFDEVINLPAIHGLVVECGGERLDMEACDIRDFRRWLDLRTGRLHREFTWHTRGGGVLRARFERFISARRRHVMALRLTLEHLDGAPVELRFRAGLDAAVRTNGFDHLGDIETRDERGLIALGARTNSDIRIAAAARAASSPDTRWRVERESRWIALTGSGTLERGGALRVEKIAALTSSRHTANDPLDDARRFVSDATAAGFEKLAAESDAVWAERWARTDVQIEGDDESQRGLRVSLYHLLRAVVEGDSRCAIDAKGAAGEAYCGRYFWDTELFMLPLFLYTRPAVGQTLARFRAVSLAGARRNARRYGYSGARYAWESAPSGDENCPNWQYADHEVHVTADVAYGLWHAHLANPDDGGFLRECVEVFVETARYWCERVTHNPDRDGYDMLMVMGPDEYTPFSRNNAYTNRMASLALALAPRAFEKLTRLDPDAAAELRRALAIGDGEFDRFAEIAGKLRVPYDAGRQLILQSDDFFDYEPLDFQRCWPDRSKRLGATVSQERLYRSRVLKQGDVIQLLATFPQEYHATQMRVAYDVYEPLTSHDSSLSKSMHAIIASWIGRHDEAWRMWRDTVGLDLQPNEAAEGIHAACAGANWLVAICGFAGFRTRMQSEVLTLAPALPRQWRAVRFPLVWEEQPLRVEITAERTVIEHHGQRPLEALISGRAVTLRPSEVWRSD